MDLTTWWREGCEALKKIKTEKLVGPDRLPDSYYNCFADVFYDLYKI